MMLVIDRRSGEVVDRFGRLSPFNDEHDNARYLNYQKAVKRAIDLACLSNQEKGQLIVDPPDYENRFGAVVKASWLPDGHNRELHNYRFETRPVPLECQLVYLTFCDNFCCAWITQKQPDSIIVECENYRWQHQGDNRWIPFGRLDHLLVGSVSAVFLDTYDHWKVIFANAVQLIKSRTVS